MRIARSTQQMNLNEEKQLTLETMTTVVASSGKRKNVRACNHHVQQIEL